MFDMKNRQKEIAEIKGDDEDKSSKDKESEKILDSGNFFGEVSLLFGCRRTATVKSEQFSQCAELNHKDFQHLINEHKWFKKYLVNNIKMRYDDDLKIFLTTCLRKIDYFKDPSITETELIHVAMYMMAMQADKDDLIIDS